MADDPTKAWFEAIQQMWNPAGIPLPTAFAPTMDPAEVDRKIHELQAVEGWLKAQLGLLQMTIKTLEMQKAAIETIKESVGKSSEGK